MTFNDDTHVASTPSGEWHPKGPVGKVLRYSDNCYNGDCVRTFQDGKKARFQAPYCFDGAGVELEAERLLSNILGPVSVVLYL